MIIGLTGAGGAGKDTVADHLVKHYGFIKLSWATPLKRGLAAMGFPEPADRADKEKVIEGFDFSWRQAAQALGTEWGRALDPKIWIKLVGQIMEEQPRVHWVISDCRFENEALVVRRLGGQVWHLRGRQADLGVAAGHVSESGLVHGERDEVIHNIGTVEQLYLQVDHLMRESEAE